MRRCAAAIGSSPALPSSGAAAFPRCFRRPYLSTSVFDFDLDDRQMVAAKLKNMADSQTISTSSTTPSGTSSSASSMRNQAATTKAAAEMATIWLQDAKSRGGTSSPSIGTQLDNDADTNGGNGLFSPKDIADKLIAEVRHRLPPNYVKHVDDIIQGAQAKKSNERLQEALLRKHAARVDTEAARAAVADAKANEGQWLREEPRRGDRPDFGSAAHDAWSAHHRALQAAVRDAEATELVVRVCMEVQEEKLRLETQQSGVYELATYAAKYSYTFMSVLLIGVYQLFSGLWKLKLWFAGRTSYQHLVRINKKVDELERENGEMRAAMANSPAATTNPGASSTEPGVGVTYASVHELSARVASLEEAIAKVAASNASAADTILLELRGRTSTPPPAAEDGDQRRPMLLPLADILGRVWEAERRAIAEVLASPK